MAISDFNIQCSISYVLGRRGSVFRRLLRGGPKAEGCFDELASAIMQHLNLCGRGITGVNSTDAAKAAIVSGLGLAEAVHLADMARPHRRIEDSGMQVAGAILGAIRAAGGNIERVRPLAPWHTSPPRGLPPDHTEGPPPGWYD